MVRYWSFSLFYVMSELWSSTILSMLFWGFANEITRLGEAKRFYSLIALSFNLATIASGAISAYFCQGAWSQSIVWLTSIVMGSGCVILGLYRYINKRVLPHEKDLSLSATQEPKKKMHLSLKESFKALAKSKYLLSLTLIVLSYNVVINLVEVIWKDQVCMLYPSPGDYNAYMSHITTLTGVLSFLLSLLVSGQMVRKFGWTLTALTTRSSC